MKETVVVYSAAAWWLMRLLAVVACGCMALSASRLYPYFPENALEAIFWALLGAGFLNASAAVSWRIQRESDETHVLSVTHRRHLAHWMITLLGVAGMLAVSEMNGNRFHITWLEGSHYHVQFALLCLSIAALIWGLGGMRWQHPHVWLAWYRQHRRECWIITAVALMAFFLRFWQLQDSVRLFLDEANFASAVRNFWELGDTRLFHPFAEVTAFPFLYAYFQSFTVELFGRNLIGLRAVSVLVGTLSIPAVYLLGRTLFNRKIALLAALLLATFPPHIHFSRMGLNNIADSLFGVLALAFMARGLQAGRRLDYVLAGVFLGMTQYFYEGGRLLYPALVVVWLVGVWLLGQRRTRFNFRVLSGLLAMILTAAIVALPVYYTLYALQRPLAARFEIVGAVDQFTRQAASDIGGTLERWSLAFRDALLTFVNLPEMNRPYYYGGETPLVLVYLTPALLLGVAYALRGFRSKALLLLLLWVLLTVLGNTLLAAVSVSARYVTTFPPLMLLAALGLYYTASFIIQRYAYLVMLLIVAVLGAAQVMYYFGPHLAYYNHQLRPHLDATDAVFRSVDFPPGTRVHLIGREEVDVSFTLEILHFLADGLDLSVQEELTSDYLADQPRDIDHAFFLNPRDSSGLALLRSQFEVRGPYYTPYDIPPDKQFVLYYAHCRIGCAPQSG